MLTNYIIFLMLSFFNSFFKNKINLNLLNTNKLDFNFLNKFFFSKRIFLFKFNINFLFVFTGVFLLFYFFTFFFFFKIVINFFLFFIAFVFFLFLIVLCILFFFLLNLFFFLNFFLPFFYLTLFAIKGLNFFIGVVGVVFFSFFSNRSENNNTEIFNINNRRFVFNSIRISYYSHTLSFLQYLYKLKRMLEIALQKNPNDKFAQKKLKVVNRKVLLLELSLESTFKFDGFNTTYSGLKQKDEKATSFITRSIIFFYNSLDWINYRLNYISNFYCIKMYVLLLKQNKVKRSVKFENYF